MKKLYIQPKSLEVNFCTEGMIAASVGFGYTEYDGTESLTNKKSFWDTEDAEEETSGIW